MAPFSSAQPSNSDVAGGDVTVNPSLRHSRSNSSTDVALFAYKKSHVEDNYNDRWTLKKRPWRRHVMPFERIVNHTYDGKGTQEEPFAISWLEGDLENPLAQPERDIWVLCVYVSLSTLGVSFASSAYAGTLESIAMTLGGSEIVITLGISLYVVGFALGPLIVGPCSEVIGRRWTFLASYALFTLWSGVACASPNLASLLVFRFFAGACGSCPLTNSGGVIADSCAPKMRGLAMTIFSACVFLGPPLGPIAGSFLSENAGWRWVMGLIAIFAGIILAIGFFMHTETYAPVLLRQRAERLSKATGKHYVSKADIGKNHSFWYLLKVALVRPWLLFFHEPIVLLLSLYVSVVYAILYSFFSAFPIVYGQVRGWNTGISGLAFVGVLIGMFLASVLQVVYINPRYAKTLKKYGGVLAPPEERLPQAIWAAPLLVVGLAGFAATTSPSVHWSASIIFSGVVGCGMVMIFTALQSYVIDAYLLYAASVLAAASVARSLLAAIFPIIVPFMYNPGGASGSCPTATCGVHVGPAISGAIALLFAPAPWYFYRNGASIRKRCKYSAEADKILAMLIKPVNSASNSAPTPAQPTEKTETSPPTPPTVAAAKTDAAEQERQKDDVEQQA